MKLNKPRLIFWIRLILWLAVGCATPIAVFAIKFGLFTTETIAVDSLGNPIDIVDTSINGWGIVSCLVLGSYIINIVKEVADATSGYSLSKQIWKGISDTIPLIILFVTCYFLSGVMSQVMFCLVILIVCKLVSCPINPLPKWKWEKQGVEDYEQVSQVLTKFVTKLTRGGL